MILDQLRGSADIVAIALSHDGRLLFAEGLAGVDAAGAEQLDQGASLVVYDARNGQIRLILGQLGDGWLGLEPGLMP